MCFLYPCIQLAVIQPVGAFIPPEGSCRFLAFCARRFCRICRWPPLEHQASPPFCASDLISACDFGVRHVLGTTASRSFSSQTVKCLICHNVYIVSPLQCSKSCADYTRGTFITLTSFLSPYHKSKSTFAVVLGSNYSYTR